MKRTTNAAIRKGLTALILVCLAIALVGSTLFIIFSDFLARFATDAF